MAATVRDADEAAARLSIHDHAPPPPPPLEAVVDPPPPSLDNTDVLFLIASLATLDDLASIVLISKDWRATALRADLPHWRQCERRTFCALRTPAASAAWDCRSLSRLLVAKPLVASLDLTGVQALGTADVRTMAGLLPPALRMLTLRSSRERPAAELLHPDAMLDALLGRVESLPHLQCLDLQGVLTERSLAGLRLLQQQRREELSGPSAGRAAQQRRRPLSWLLGGGDGVSGAAAAAVANEDATASDARRGFARALPALEVLSVGFHTFTALGHREGREYLLQQLALAPRVQRVGCLIDSSLCVPLDIKCRLCGSTLYRRLSSYIVHPPQQPHITYELHTDVPPLAAATHAVDNDPTRLQCARRCHNQLWLVDGGSGHVVHVCERKFAIACGPATSHGRRSYPPLAVAVPASDDDDDDDDRAPGAPSSASAAEAVLPDGGFVDHFPTFEGRLAAI